MAIPLKPIGGQAFNSNAFSSIGHGANPGHIATSMCTRAAMHPYLTAALLIGALYVLTARSRSAC